MHFDIVKVQDKEAFKLLGLDVAFQTLDECMQLSSLIIGSRYVKRL
jgi:hypothetical protein